MSKASRNRDIARAKIAQMRAEEARRAKRRNLLVGISTAAVVAVVAVVIALVATAGGPSGPGKTAGKGSAPQLKTAALSTVGPLQPAPSAGAPGPEGVPVPSAPALAGTASAATGQKVDGIRCQRSEQTLFHIHAHLTIFVNGSPRQVPAGIGIPGSQVQSTSQGPLAAGGTCIYWLHAHSSDGIIHIESPVQRVYTLGDFFDLWGQPLGPNTLGPVTGHVTALYNGKVYVGNPRDIPLNKHAQIQLEVGKPLVAPETVTFPNGL